MTTTEPMTEQGWAQRIEAANRGWRKACLDRDAAQKELDAAYEGHRAWREQPEQMQAAWEPILARMSGELGVDFALQHTGGGCMAIGGTVGVVRMLITDYGDGDTSHPQAGKGWWIGFSLPDAPWTGDTESIVGDPDARDADDLIRFVAYALSGFMRGERHQIASRPSDYSDGIPRIPRIDYRR